MEREKRFKVGELARRTGLSVRTLHHYDEIGLLQPSHRSTSGHRLYDGADLARLQQVLSLRSLGFGLDQIREALRQPHFSPLRVIELHLSRLQEGIEAQRRLADRLERIAVGLREAGEVSAEEFIQTIEAINMIEKYYTPEQMEQLRQRREAVGEERIREVEQEWPRLMDEVRAEMEAGTDPADPRVQELARRWMRLVREFTGGDPGITASVKAVWQNEENVHGIDTAGVRDLGAYVQRAMQAGGHPPL